MANESLHAAKVVLLAVQFATKADISALQLLKATYQNVLRTEIVLRILLTYLPESLESSAYVPFLQELASGQTFVKPNNNSIDSTSLDDISNTQANKKVRKLRLLHLAWPFAPSNAPSDLLTLFLIHRAYRIDKETGLITQLPELIVPFIGRSPFLRSWMISVLLPLLRLNYEYHPQDGASCTILEFEDMDDETGIELLLCRTGVDIDSDGDSKKTVGRDLRGLVGPWMYGDTRWKRQMLRKPSGMDAQTVVPLNDVQLQKNSKCGGWEEVFIWITSKASASWVTAVEAIEQWDGPGDLDLGGYGDGTVWMSENEQQQLEQRYARAAMSAAYLIPDSSAEALMGVQRILARLYILMDYSAIANLPVAADQLATVPSISEDGILAPENASFLRARMLEDQNILTTPKNSSIAFLHGLLISAFLLTRAGVPCTIRKVGELVLLQKGSNQMLELERLLRKFEDGPKGDDKFWIRSRNELIWLRDWDTHSASKDLGRGVFGRIRKDILEMEILKALLSNTRYTLARSLYETAHERLLTVKQMQDTIMFAAMQAYDNASNANRTRGGVKKCNDILLAFPDTFSISLAKDRMEHLITVTHMISNYRLVLKQGQPFRPVDLRVHSDPLSVIGKILEQNPRCYTEINEILQIGDYMVKSGLTVGDIEGKTPFSAEDEADHLTDARRRTTGLCIDAALAEDDFETAYSYVMNRLSAFALPAQTRSPPLDHQDSDIFATPPPRCIDDWSWRAALQAGKYRMNAKTVRPTHVGNASGNLEIRHLGQRMECLSQALRIAPPSTLQEILNVYRRCEEELDTKLIEEAEQEAAWDAQGDQTSMPGAFGKDLKPATLSRGSAPTRSGEEAPMSLFDLTRASATRAQNSIAQLTMLKSSTASPKSSGSSRVTSFSASNNPSDTRGRTSVESERSDGGAPRTRKRDQFRDAAVGTLASGIGWLINAPAPPAASFDSEDGPPSPTSDRS